MSSVLASDETITLSQFASLLWQRRWLIVLCGFGAAVLAFGASYLITPVFRATTIVVPTSHQAQLGLADSLGGSLGSFGGLASLMGVNLGGDGAGTEEALAVMRSRQFTETFIRERNLLPILYADKWDAAGKKWKVAPDREPTVTQAYKKFNRGIRNVFQDKKTRLVTVQIDWEDPAMAADWANDLVRRVNAEMRRRAIVEAGAALQYLEKELESTVAVDTRTAINRLVEGQVNARMIANVTAEYSFRVVDPALVPDPQDRLRPKRVFMAILAGFVGGVLGIVITFLLGAARDPRST